MQQKLYFKILAGCKKIENCKKCKICKEFQKMQQKLYFKLLMGSLAVLLFPLIAYLSILPVNIYR